MSLSQSKLSLWLLAARPKTLPAAVAPVAVGTAVAFTDGLFALLPALAAFSVAMLLQIAVNLANDYFDARNNIDSEERLGPVRVTQSGLIPQQQVRQAMIITLILSGLVFLYLMYVAGTISLWVALGSILSALAYSGGPYPLASNGLGELFVFIFFGLVAVCGSYWVQALTLTWTVVLASVAPGLLITAIMVVNNLRDIPTDAAAGKRTLAVRLGEEGTIRFYRRLMQVSYLCLPLLALCMSRLLLLLPLIVVPMAIALCREVKEFTGEALNATLARTAKFSLLFSLLMAAGMIL